MSHAIFRWEGRTPCLRASVVHAKVEAGISPEQEQMLMEILGDEAWEAFQEMGDMLNPTGSKEAAGDFWNNN